MEASGALGGAPAGADGAQQGEQGQGEQQAGPDLSAITGQLATMAQGQQDLRAFMEQLAQPQQEPEPAWEPDLGFMADPTMDPERQQQMLAQTVQEAAQRQAQGMLQEFAQNNLNPLQQQVSEMRNEQMFGQLVAEFPEIGENPEVASQLLQASSQLVQAHGWPQEMAGDPRFIRLAYAASKAFEQGNADNSAGGQDPGVAHLEGGAARPGASGANLGDEIFASTAGRGGRALPF